MVREAIKDDLPFLYDLSLVTHRHGYDALIPDEEKQRFKRHYTDTPLHRKKFTDKLMQKFQDPAWTIWVAEYNGRIVGYTMREKLGEKNYYKRGLFVDPSFQGRGIGKELFQLSIQGLEHAQVRLVVISNNTKAIHLYEKNGFRKTPLPAPSFYGADQTVMLKDGAGL